MVGRLRRRNMAGTPTPCRVSKGTTWLFIVKSMISFSNFFFAALRILEYVRPGWI
jgi:hypothetical protein